MRSLKREIWPYKVTLSVFEEKETSLVSWLGEKMGPFKGRWNMVHHYKGVDVYFKTGNDATLFSLKWS